MVSHLLIERTRRAVRGLRRDATRQESDDVERQLELCRIMWWMRHVALASALLLNTITGNGETALIIVGAFALDVTGHVVVRRRPGAARVFIAIDLVTLIVLAVVGMPALLVLILSVAVLAWAATFRPTAAIIAFLGVTLATWISFARAIDLHATTAYIGFDLLGAIFVIRMIRLNMAARRATEREHLVTEGVDAIIWEAEPGSAGTLKVSPAAERLLGYKPGEFTRPGFLADVLHPDDRWQVGTLATMRGGETLVTRLRRADGEYRSFENHMSVIGAAGARSEFVVGVLVDRTEQMDAERNALALGHLMASSPIGQIMLCRRDGEPMIDALNQACTVVLGIEGESIGRRFVDCVPSPLADRLLALVETRPHAPPTEVVGADGRIYQATARRLDPVSCSIDFLDVTERIEHARLLHDQARQDDLTGLANRRGLIEALEQRVVDAPGEPTSLVMIDLDDFKEVNDALGHETGDRLLAEIARRLADAVGAGDTAARLGGDEFAVLLPGAERDVAMAHAERIVEIVNRAVVLGELRLRVRASVGVAAFPEDASHASELVRRADVAMYTAKHRGSSVEHYDPTADPFDRDRLALAGELEDAIGRDELILHHQPVIDVATGTIVGTEALVRWQHPRLGLVPPTSFIELAEVSGLIRPLTRWVARRALRDLAALDLPAGSDFKVSVNLSVRNLYEHDLIEWFRAALAEANARPEQLVIEITESMIMEDQTTAGEVLAGLRSLGVRTWIDDFGTGHSSFSRLRDLPVDGVKIDRSFVAGATRNESDRIVLQSIIELVRSLGLESIAEGVEDADCLHLLGSLGCDTAQGYHIARPMTLDALRDRLHIDATARAMISTL